MNVSGLEVCCPVCKADLEEGSGGSESFVCSGCGRRFPIILGIPDFRVFPDPYIDLEADRAKGRRVAERFNDLDFAGLVEFYYSITDVVPPNQARRFTRGLLAAGARAEAALTAWEERDGNLPIGSGRFLEIGCGTAPLLVAAAARYHTVVGVDIAFRWLVVGKKRLAEATLEIPLFCACAEALPFRAGTFDRVAAESVIELVDDQAAAMTEAYRVMRPGGRLMLATPNRFSLGPDPHVGLWAGGLMPQRWIDAHAKRQGAVPPKRHLLSAGSLSRLLRDSGFARRDIFLPDVPRAQRAQLAAPAQLLVGAYHALKRLPLMKQLLYVVGPLLHAVAHKNTAPTG